MNSNRRSRRTNVAVRAVALIAATMQFGIASADEADPKFTLVHIRDAAFGHMIRSGRYERAIDKITGQKVRVTDARFSATNLCVAYIMTRELDKASGACDLAIVEAEERVAKLEESTSRYAGDPKAKAFREFLAIAYSNRGVLRALDGADDLARDDFERAQELTGKFRATKANLARLAARKLDQAA